MAPLLFLCTLLILIATLLPVSRHPHWMVRGLDFPRLQIGALSALLLLAQVFFLDLHLTISWALLTATAICVSWQLWWILPYTPLWPKEAIDSIDADSDRKICVLTSNVLTTNRNAELLIHLAQLHRPDILVTLESDQWWENELKALEPEMPYSIKCPLDNFYGMHVFSCLPLIEKEISFLVEDDVPSIHALVKMRSGDEVRMHFLHPAPPSPTENPESKERDAELIIVGRSVAESKQPVIVVGDLNDVAWSATTRLFRKISGLLDPRVGRGLFNTFHVNYPLLRWPLDHLFHSDHFTICSIGRLPSIGSDHFPLLTCLTLAPLQDNRQEGLDADNADRVWADEITEAMDVKKSDVPKPSE
jgi:endonuclease/exonuclease/phosphatase (EEP) superfamily protein YafD